MEQLARQIEDVKKKLGFDKDAYPKVIRDKAGNLKAILIHRPKIA